jgi:hypothetical protein
MNHEISRSPQPGTSASSGGEGKSGIPRWPAPITLACAIICFGIGYGVAKRSAPQKATPEPQPAAAEYRADEASAGAEMATASPAPVPWHDKWRQASRRPACPLTTRERAALLEELARTNPEEALKLALAETNLLIRDELRAAALRGWAAVAPDAASEWALAQPVLGERMRCVEAVLSGAVEDPAAAVRIALKTCESDPEPALSYGHALINALVERTGDFKTAVEFANAATMVDGQSFLIDSAYYQWAQHEPERLFSEISSITDPELRDAAMNGLVQGLASADAQTLASYAKSLPEGEDRKRMFEAALPTWGSKDPETVMAWIDEVGPHPDFDQGLSVLSRRDEFSGGDPSKAMELADNITDSVMRGMAKSDIFLNWAYADYAAAEKYAHSVKSPEYREMFLGTLEAVAASSD